MATANITKVIVTLELNPVEAQTLADIFYCIGGSETTSRRKHTTSMLLALADVSVRAGDDLEVMAGPSPTDMSGTIYFKDYSNEDNG